MENMADALKMAAWVLIFVLALSISISSFSQVRATMQTVIDYKDRETGYIYGNYYYQGNGKDRQVGVETIIPAMYRAYKENYKIVFEMNDGNYLYWKDEDRDNTIDDDEKINYIDLEKEVMGNDKDAKNFIDIILYGYKIDEDESIRKKFGQQQITFDRDRILC